RCYFISFFFFFFFFQAEDGIRDRTVTGVQTCALPICVVARARRGSGGRGLPAEKPIPPVGLCHQVPDALVPLHQQFATECEKLRSEERRVGKECRSRVERDDEKKKEKKDTE